MKYLEEMIIKYGEILPGRVLKVDGFLNHQMDPEVYKKIGREFYRLFGNLGVTKLLTVEASGIGIAAVTALYFNVPAIFAKKGNASNMQGDYYVAHGVKSYTHSREYDMAVSKRRLNSRDKALIIDDFLAEGQAVLGLKSIVEQAGAELTGCGIVIEKGFQNGGRMLREMGVRLESLAVIMEMSERGIEFGKAGV